MPTAAVQPEGAPKAPPSRSGPVPPGRGGGRRPFLARRKVCRFCAEQVAQVDFKQIQLLRTFTTERGKILSSRITGNCAKHQRQLTKAIKRVRNLALLSFTPL